MSEDTQIPTGLDLDRLLQRRQTAHESKQRMEAVIAECNLALAAVLDLNETEKIERLIDDNVYTFFRRKGSPGRKVINPTKLMAKGVPAHVIQECTEIGEPSKPSIVVSKKALDESADNQAS